MPTKAGTDTVRVPEEATDMELVHEFDYYGTLKPPVSFGSRMFLEVVEGQVTGKRAERTAVVRWRRLDRDRHRWMGTS